MANEYHEQLLSFQSKMNSMVSNFLRTGYIFDGYEKGDLLQELNLKVLQVEDRYDSSRGAALRTWWYRVMQRHLVQIAERGSKSLCAIKYILDGKNDIDIRAPILIDGDEWHEIANQAVEVLLERVRAVDPELAEVCDTILRCNGSKQEAADILGKPLYVVEFQLLRIRSWPPFQEVINSIPL